MKKLLFILLFPSLASSELYIKLDKNNVVEGVRITPLKFLQEGWTQHRVYGGKWISKIQFGKTIAQIDDKGKIEGFLTTKEDGRGYYLPYNSVCQRMFRDGL